MKPNNSYVVNISLYSIFQGLFVLGGIWLGFILRDVLVITVLSFIVSSGIILAAKFFKKSLFIPYSLGVFFVFTILAGVATLLYQLIVPTISSEFSTLVNNFPRLISDLNSFVSGLLGKSDFSITDYLNNANNTTNIGSVTWDVITGLFFTTKSIIDTILYIAFFLAATFYMAIKPSNLDNIINFFFKSKNHKSVSKKINEARTKVGYWLAGQCLISFILACLTYPFLAIMNVPYALLLSLVAAFLNLIPIIGPILSAVPAIILALVVDFKIALATGLFYLILQQIDGNFITPLIMRKVTGIHPLIVMIVILLGTSLAGALGALIALPVVSVISIFVKDLEE